MWLSGSLLVSYISYADNASCFSQLSTVNDEPKLYHVQATTETRHLMYR